MKIDIWVNCWRYPPYKNRVIATAAFFEWKRTET